MAPIVAVARSVAALALGACVSAPASVAGAVARTGHPIEEVIVLLQGLDKKAEQEGKDEEVLYTKFEYWCGSSKKSLNKAIAEEKSTIERLQDEISSHEKSIEVLGKEMAELKDEIAELATAGEKATEDRKAAADLYTESSTAHTATISAIDEAIKALEKSQSETDSATLNLSQQKVRALLALLGMKVSDEERSRLQGFVAYEPKERPDTKAAGDYEGHIKKYSFKSDSVIELLKELKLKFEDELTEMNAEETNAINAFQLSSKAREQSSSAKQASYDEKDTIKGETEGALAQADADLQSTPADLKADTDSLDSTTKSCSVKKAEWAERSEMRENERKAIAAAIKILAKATGVRVSAPENPALPPSPVSLVEVRRLLKGGSPVQRAIELLRDEAKVSHSQAMEQLAQQLAMRKDEGPFDQVINAIQKMIFHLKDEQTKEDDHKNWCDFELSKTSASIADKKDKLEELTVKIEEHTGTAASLAEDITSANEMIATIQEHIKEATEIREIGRKENDLAIKDAQDAQTAISNAISVLKDFYKSSGGMAKEAYELVQRSKDPVDLPNNPATWDSEYTRVADPTAQPDGIVTVLEKVSADFSQMESDTKAQEASDQEAYDEDVKACKIEKARRAQEVEMKTQERKRVLQKKMDMDKEHKRVSGEHEATVQYLADLQPACVEGSSTYAERRDARAKEIEALTQAQELLQNAFEDKAVKSGKLLQVQQRRLRGVIAAF
eukprot:CAMPEP_0176105864 /NCGR_PEP_ID=MMETSP0120_2-20121206/53125_1 /TAXON_ID=160619 /ORGANISM="Kryptoperidinium foliaceum, Strain CCMP 1326" /LENGTH=730 /DNA_ID=CAMNT_0017439983 /DNA_START=59 /DNA_END=2251 /DNA_ORIENTATION=-